LRRQIVENNQKGVSTSSSPASAKFRKDIEAPFIVSSFQAAP
jgi:hypothetical protein